jgi:hypothetical protein
VRDEVKNIFLQIRAGADDGVDLVLADHLGERDAEFGRGHRTGERDEHLATGFGRSELALKPVLQLLEESGVELGRARQTISARQADALVAAELDVAIGTALLDVRRLVFDAQDKPVQWLHGLYRPDRYEYQLEVSQVGSIDARISVKDTLQS